MARSNLRIYRGPAETQAPVRSASKAAPATVTVDLNEVLPLLADAVASRRTWLSDFEDDQITIRTIEASGKATDAVLMLESDDAFLMPLKTEVANLGAMRFERMR